MTDYKVGDKVWYARYAPAEQVKITCPICVGKKVVTLILGDGTQMELPCEYCGKGYDASRGYVNDYQLVAKPELVTIDRVEIRETASGQEREYHTNVTSCSWHNLPPGDIFATEEEARIRAEARAEGDRERRERQQYAVKQMQNRDYSWQAGYHTRCANKARREAEYHEAQAVICKQKARTP